MSKFNLGRGIESLLPDNFDVEAVSGAEERIKNVFITEVHPNPDQPRKEFSEEGISELASSIKQHGVIQPLVVTPDNGGYRIVAGERRWRASTKAGLEKVPVIVRTHAELEELEIALVENVQRVDLSPLEQAMSIMRLHSQFSLSFKDIAKKLGKAETTISNIVRLLQLPEEAKNALQKNSISEGHARTILSLKDYPDQQKMLLHRIVQEGLSVRRAEQLVSTIKASEAPKTDNPKKVRQAIPVEMEKHLDSWGTKIGVNKISHSVSSNGSGKIHIHFANQEELKRIIKNL